VYPPLHHRIPGEQSMADRTLLAAEQLVDGTGRPKIPEAAVLIEKGIIADVGPVKTLQGRYPSANLILRNGETILPGLVDSHTHLAMDPTLPDYLSHLDHSIVEQTLRAAVSLRADILAGITTLRCCGDKEFLDVECRRAVTEGWIEGPRLVVASRAIKASGAYGFVAYPLNDLQSSGSFIRENAARGADFTKIFISQTLRQKGQIAATMRGPEIRGIVEESHRAGLPVAAHCAGGPALDWALEAGLDTLEHIYFASEKQIDAIATAGRTVVLTLSPFLNERRVRNLPLDHVEAYLDAREEVSSRLSSAISSGLRFALGTDGMHGRLADEACFAVGLGADPLVVLRALTGNGAGICGFGERIGTLERGKAADIITVRGDPIKDMRVLRDIGLVIKNGQIVRNAN
jgi:imidazolonepropionase-like amidohydrolase